ncbi:bifunctional transcriptional activator/DNA repair enzyme AdaA [Jeotgalibacillus salarius]|uniref:methylated-DNA--[protein]-cysteine S-methyltransferase n=1 Tax=Jeotgalibacillus salarius TaxID=546023 RepID=A0A4Y8LDC1_9BACL|nr:trifunctional transcriptional activator/DNA repair protein Ada/methylated-DNA--[protein]-cysteine S-methyltransferase [Jeotgalibacillus salarius]TFE00690.1 bifunctional transcriptional activator/DNA repair protein Ada [Jeotgalibacillus salarius]
MMTGDRKQEFYDALLERNTEYEGFFFVGVKSTGVFCRPTCPARKPKFENCEFYYTAEEALLASFRPCKRCSPLSHPNQVSELVQTLVQAVEENPEKKWREKDFRELAVDESTARRQFKKRFGMTFVQYARARRMGLAMKEIRSGKPMIDAQLTTGYESSSGFRDAFLRIMGEAPSSVQEDHILKASWLDTRVGPMVAIADETQLFLLEFVDRRGLEKEIEVLRSKTRSAIIPGKTSPIELIERELDLYFKGELFKFNTPVRLLGTPFQMMVWDKLKKIPAGETRSYTDIACEIGKPTAVRAVARANGANQLALVIPCHRVILSDGSTGGYAGGSIRKKWLLDLESKSNYQVNE